jgi:hypothetical protein
MDSRPTIMFWYTHTIPTGNMMPPDDCFRVLEVPLDDTTPMLPLIVWLRMEFHDRADGKINMRMKAIADDYLVGLDSVPMAFTIEGGVVGPLWIQVPLQRPYAEHYFDFRVTIEGVDGTAVDRLPIRRVAQPYGVLEGDE